jgi:hypothetical protein
MRVLYQVIAIRDALRHGLCCAHDRMLTELDRENMNEAVAEASIADDQFEEVDEYGRPGSSMGRPGALGRTSGRNKGRADGYGLKFWCAYTLETTRVLQAADSQT